MEKGGDRMEILFIIVILKVIAREVAVFGSVAKFLKPSYNLEKRQFE
ncbi:hypothetical protein [Bacillus cereus]|nr:hypothetical protein [Bacillus cereus]